MDDPRDHANEYLAIDDVLGFYADIFGIADEQASDLLRDHGGLASAIARPRQYAFYEGADLASQAAVLGHGIAEGQFFLDGNKRTAAVVVVVFLRLNGFDLGCTKAELAEWVLALGMGEPVERFADRLRVSLRPRR